MRKTETITITAEGRDQGKVFKITEMPAAAAERWALQALFALLNTGVDIPPDLAEAGMAGWASLGFDAFARLPFAAAEPLLADMWVCVQYQPDPAKPSVVRPLIEEDIEEVGTRIRLRKSVWDLHIGFFTVGGPST